MSRDSRCSCRVCCISPIEGRPLDRIDVHFHVVPPSFAEAMRRGDFESVVSIVPAGPVEQMVLHAPADVPVEPETELEPAQYDDRLLRAALDARKLDAAAVSPPPELFFYWTEPAIAAR